MSKADGSLVFSTNIDNSKAAKKLEELQKKIADVEKEIEEKQTNRNAIMEDLEAAKKEAIEAQNAVDMLNKALDESREITSVKGDSVSPQEYLDAVDQQEQLTAQLKEKSQILAACEKTAQRLAAQDEKAVIALEKSEKKLDKMQRKAGELTEEITSSSSVMGRMKEATAKADQQMEKFADHIKNLAKRVFVFSLITSALRSMRTWFGNVIKSNKEATAAIAKLKGALLTLIQPLVNVIIPALTTFVNLLTKVVNAAARVLSGIFGTTAAESAKAAEALYNQTEALDSTGDAAKKASKSLANFDEINSLDDNSDSSSGSSDSSIAPDFSGVVSGGLSSVAELFVGIALVALGAVLTFSGASIPVGLAMMVAGGMMVYSAVTEDPAAIQEALSGGLGTALSVIGPFIAILGVVLLAFGHIGIGIAMLLAGVSIFAIGETSQEEDLATSLVENLKAVASAIGPIIGIIGVAVMCLANIGLGLAMIVAGAALFGVGNADYNEGTLGETIVGILSDTLKVVGILIAVVGLACLCYGMIPLGLGMIIAGVSIFAVSEVLANWQLLSTDLVTALMNVLNTVGPYIALIGLLLLFVPGMQAWGIGMLVAGIAMWGVSEIYLNWDSILEKIRDAWEGIKRFWNENIAPIFTAEWWGNLAKKAINGFLSVLESGINLALKGAAALVNGIIDLINIIPGIDIAPVDWGHVQLPRLAQGAVIPPNREFLAVLGDQKSGTNIEAPLETIVQAFRQALSEQGGGGGRSQTVILQLDRRELGRAVLDVGTQESARVGLKLT